MASAKSSKDPPEATPASAENGVEAIFRAHNDTLIRFLRGRLHNDADAHEAAQEAYVRLLQLDQPDKPSFLRAYLFKIAGNVALDLMRRRRTQKAFVLSEGSDDVQPTQERALAARQELQRVETALSTLPARCREALFLSRQEGWSSSMIARHQGVSDRMVRLYICRALEHIEAMTAEADQ